MKNIKEEKKKKNFGRRLLEFCWKFFLVCFFILIIATAILYWQFYKMLGYGLEGFSYCLARSITSEQNYDWIQDKADDWKNATPEQREKWIQEKIQEVSEHFNQFIKQYKESVENLNEKEKIEETWGNTLRDLSKQLLSMYEDGKISPEELQNFLQKVESSLKKDR